MMVYTCFIHLLVDVLFQIICKNITTREENMKNLNEECLINYLQKPDELSHTTDILKLNNALILKNKLFLAKKYQVNYTNKVLLV